MYARSVDVYINLCCDFLLATTTTTTTFSTGVDSGGDPIEIRKLTFNEFRDFHDLYYHPANSRIFFYGDDPVYLFQAESRTMTRTAREYLSITIYLG